MIARKEGRQRDKAESKGSTKERRNKHRERERENKRRTHTDAPRKAKSASALKFECGRQEEVLGVSSSTIDLGAQFGGSSRSPNHSFEEKTDENEKEKMVKTKSGPLYGIALQVTDLEHRRILATLFWKIFRATCWLSLVPVLL